MFCENCGAKVKDGVKFCKNCGATITPDDEGITEVKKEEAIEMTELLKTNEEPPKNMTAEVKKSDLTKQIFNTLNEGDFGEAETLIHNYLASNNVSVKIYLAKLFIEMKVKNADELKKVNRSISGSENYKEVLRLSNDKTRDILIKISEDIDNAISKNSNPLQGSAKKTVPEVKPEIKKVIICKNCGNEVQANRQFCNKCGADIDPNNVKTAEVKSSITANVSANQNKDGMLSYIDNQISSTTKFTSAQNLIDNGTPIWGKLYIISIIAVILCGILAYMGFDKSVYLIVLFALLLIFTEIFAAIKYFSLKNIAYDLSKNVDTSDLADFLCKNLQSLGFTDWTVVKSQNITFRFKSRVIQITFKRDKMQYNIKVHGNPYNHTTHYSRAYIVNPIISAAIDYYCQLDNRQKTANNSKSKQAGNVMPTILTLCIIAVIGAGAFIFINNYNKNNTVEGANVTDSVVNLNMTDPPAATAAETSALAEIKNDTTETPVTTGHPTMAAPITTVPVTTAEPVQPQTSPILADWRTSLETLLKGFPSIFDEATKQRNEELIGKFWDNPNYNPNPDEYPSYAEMLNTEDIIGFGDNPWTFSLPYICSLYDLDNNGIPEVFITYLYEDMYPSSVVYKLNGNTYEKLTGYIDPQNIYVNYQNKLVFVNNVEGSIEGIVFVEIKNKEIVFSDYVDSKGRDYKDINIDYGSDEYNNLLQDEGFKEIPELYYPNILYEVRYGAPMYQINTSTAFSQITRYTVWSAGNKSMSINVYYLQNGVEKYNELDDISDVKEIADINGDGINEIVVYKRAYDIDYVSPDYYPYYVEIYNIDSQGNLINTSDLYPEYYSSELDNVNKALKYYNENGDTLGSGIFYSVISAEQDILNGVIRPTSLEERIYYYIDLSGVISDTYSK
ncbi:MAG: zinc ribbon domain-containing protein [Oscillospiraceae bacterium]|nr:zinc ribbon domain-containing protein [Oscillospiraceae bacterium]